MTDLPVALLKRQIEAMAAVKLNVLHWHLCDDQAFRVECESLPRLHELGSGGAYYSRDEIRGIVRFAAARDAIYRFEPGRFGRAL